MSVCITLTTPSGIVVASDSRCTRNLIKRGETNYCDNREKAVIMNDTIVSHVGNGYITDHTDIDTQVFLEAVKEKYKDRTISVHKWPSLLIMEWEKAMQQDSYRKYKNAEMDVQTEESAVYFTIAGYSTKKTEKDIPHIYKIDTFKKEVELVSPKTKDRVYKIVQDGGFESLKTMVTMNKRPIHYSLDRAIDYARFAVITQIRFDEFITDAKQVIGGKCNVYAIDKIRGIAGRVDENNKIISDPLVKITKRTIL